MRQINFSPKKWQSNTFNNNNYKSFNPYTKDSNINTIEDYEKDNYSMISSSKVIPIVRGKNPIRGICRKSPIYRMYKKENIIISPIIHYEYYQRNNRSSLYPYDYTPFGFIRKLRQNEMLFKVFADSAEKNRKHFPNISNHAVFQLSATCVYGIYFITGINPW